jgi:hypothetical protein
MVEVWVRGRLHFQGVVEDVMPDKSGLWLAARGWDGRKFIDIGPRDEIRACSPKL